LDRHATEGRISRRTRTRQVARMQQLPSMGLLASIVCHLRDRGPSSMSRPTWAAGGARGDLCLPVGPFSGRSLLRPTARPHHLLKPHSLPHAIGGLWRPVSGRDASRRGSKRRRPTRALSESPRASWRASLGLAEAKGSSPVGRQAGRRRAYRSERSRPGYSAFATASARRHRPKRRAISLAP